MFFVLDNNIDWDTIVQEAGLIFYF
jgi:hypothetical protein